MPATVVVLPSTDSALRASLLVELRSRGLVVIDVDVDLSATDPAPLSVRVCAEIIGHHPEPPLFFIAWPDSAHLLPAVALAQRTAHRPVCGYALINPEVDPSAADWPDAPVVVIGSDAQATGLNRARLRGWSQVIAESPDAIADEVVSRL